MNLENERLDRAQLEHLSTAELVRHALAEAKLLVRAEVLHAKKELGEELKAARTSGILIGAGAVLALVSLAAFIVAAGLALPVADWLGVLVAGGVFLLLGVALALAGVKKLPRKPLPHTQERLRADLNLTRETLQ